MKPPVQDRIIAMGNLTQAQIAAINVVGTFSDGNCLYLRTTASTAKSGDKPLAKSWVFIYRDRRGKRTELGLGSWTGRGKAGKITATLARQRADLCHRQIAEGLDPKEEKQRGRGRTVAEVQEELLDLLRPGWKDTGPKRYSSETQWRNAIDSYAAALLKEPAGLVTDDEVYQVLKPIWQTVPTVAERVRSRLERIFNLAAKERGGRPNPARWVGHLQNLLLTKPKKSEADSHAALPYKQIPEFMAELRRKEGTSARLVEFAIACANRSTEAREMEVGEVDREERYWRIPAARMKKVGGKERPHVVPLNDRALAIYDAMMVELPAGGRYVFPGKDRKGRPLADKPLSTSAMRDVLTPMGYVDEDGKPITMHGFRSGFSDWCGDKTDFDVETREFALAHGINNATVAAYRRSAAFEKRTKMMAAWDRYCAGDSGKVVPFKAA